MLNIVGMGPGNIENMTLRAYRAIENAELIVGYTLYNDILKNDFPDKEYYATPMRQEMQRCRYALEKSASGVETAMICSGDSGVYGMASLIYELAEKMENPPEICVIPGITAALSGGAMLGSPLTCDFTVISLSDLLTPWSVIEKRLNGAGAGDFATVLYNPGSAKRHEHLKKACDILLKYRSGDTVCGIAGNIARDGEYTEIMTLNELAEHEADMFMTVFIGNSATEIINGKIVNPRGYLEKREKRKADILIFGGTTEGRELASEACRAGLKTVLCVATEYGESVLGNDAENFEKSGLLKVNAGRLSEEEMEKKISDSGCSTVIDATHPYASGVTHMVSEAAGNCDVKYIRVRRNIAKGMDLNDNIIYMPAMRDVIDYLSKSREKVFFSTGSASAELYAEMTDAVNRSTIRILPSHEALSKCLNAGFRGGNLICAQGPFSQEMNLAMFRSSGAETLVTKMSGVNGGFSDKITAAGMLGMKVIVVEPPVDLEGYSTEEVKRFIREMR